MKDSWQFMHIYRMYYSIHSCSIWKMEINISAYIIIYKRIYISAYTYIYNFYACVHKQIYNALIYTIHKRIINLFMNTRIEINSVCSSTDRNIKYIAYSTLSQRATCRHPPPHPPKVGHFFVPKDAQCSEIYEEKKYGIFFFRFIKIASKFLGPRYFSKPDSETLTCNT